MIILENLSKYSVFTQPMTFGIFQNLLNVEWQKKFIISYPKNGFKKVERRSLPGKLYSFSMLPLMKKSLLIESAFSQVPDWRPFVHFLLGHAYCDALSKALDIDLSHANVNMGFYRFDTGDYVEPHVDHVDKLVTQIFYFNSEWNIINGGFLQLLSENNEKKCFLNIPPLSIYSVAIVRGEAAWHAVMPISSQSNQSRLSFQLEYYRE